MIEIRKLHKGSLADFVGKEEFKKLEFIPISPHRAQSHIHNPRAEEEDVLLLLAYEGESLLGYLGLMPDRLFDQENDFRFAWMSCLWLSENARGKGIAKQLVGTAIEVYEGRIILTEFTEVAGSLYRKTGFFESFHQLEGIRLYRRFDSAFILPPRSRVFSMLKPLLKVLDNSLNFLADLRFGMGVSLGNGLELSIGEPIDQEWIDFVQDKQGNELFRRGGVEWNWMLDYPWILQARKGEHLSNKYFFSSVSPYFGMKSIRIRNSHQDLVGVMIFTYNQDHGKMPYVYLNDEGRIALPEILKYLFEKYKISTFTTYQPDIVELLKKDKLRALSARGQTREFMISTSFLKELKLDAFRICEGDGDCGFT